MKLYTKTGDDLTTGLMYGRRVGKDHCCIALLCGIDEIVAQCGLIRSTIKDESLKDELVYIQELCFRLGTFVATFPEDRSKLDLNRSSIVLTDVSDIENKIDRLSATFEMPSAFVHPGANFESALCDSTRVIVRKVEYQASICCTQEWISKDDHLIVWLNRLSDYFYALARSLEPDQKLREMPVEQT